jgi:D-alanyl-lipoteichoic acid acyltransferase DltB (MBOAT superfamily)
MLFNSPLYGAFLIATWIVFWSLHRVRLARAAFLVLASYAFYFYGTWDAAQDEPVPIAAPWWALVCLAVIFLGSTLDYFVGLALVRTTRPAVRSALLFLSVAYYVGILCVFKYWNFAADSFTALFAHLGLRIQPAHLRLVLPFGISFFTFETMSYTIDVWRGDLRPATRYLDYLLFVCFFPHLVAGPIVRPAQMLPQLAREPRADAAMQARGLWRIATGLAKKVIIGDFLAQSIVRRVFETPERFTALEVVLGVYAYAVQIYADFSGYSDVAIGSAALFGYELPENFDVPYAARSLQEFWRRWHVTLSSWLRDYVYKPLGGSRRGPLATYRNLMITMVLGGLWHGASWTFVVWGTLHGLGLCIERVWQQATQPRRDRAEASRLARVVSTVVTFHFVCVAWVFFRSATVEQATFLLQRIARGGWSVEHVTAKVVLVLAAALLLHFVPRDWRERARETFVQTPAVVQGLVLAGVAIGLHLAAALKPEPFIYGQF